MATELEDSVATANLAAEIYDALHGSHDVARLYRRIQNRKAVHVLEALHLLLEESARRSRTEAEALRRLLGLAGRYGADDNTRVREIIQIAAAIDDPELGEIEGLLDESQHALSDGEARFVARLAEKLLDHKV